MQSAVCFNLRWCRFHWNELPKLRWLKRDCRKSWIRRSILESAWCLCIRATNTQIRRYALRFVSDYLGNKRLLWEGWWIFSCAIGLMISKINSINCSALLITGPRPCGILTKNSSYKRLWTGEGIAVLLVYRCLSGCALVYNGLDICNPYLPSRGGCGDCRHIYFHIAFILIYLFFRESGDLIWGDCCHLWLWRGPSAAGALMMLLSYSM